MNTKLKFHHFFLLFLAGVLLFSSCQKDYVVPKPEAPVIPIDTTGNATVFFAADIKPIFNANCNISCHNPGVLDLRDANAYSSLVTNASPSNKYVDTITPANSLIYTKIAGGSMNSYATDILRTNVLTWIQEGAINN